MKFLQQSFKYSFPAKKLVEEQGSVLIISLLIMVVLAMLGVVASNMSITELRSAANEHNYNQSFYAADSGWQESVSMLNSLGDDAPVADTATNAVDLTALDSTPNSVGGIPYTYSITYLGNRKAPGFGDDYRQFQYRINAAAQDPVTNTNRQSLSVTLNKPYSVK